MNASMGITGMRRPAAADRLAEIRCASRRAWATYGGRCPSTWTTSPASRTLERPWSHTVTQKMPPGPIAMKSGSSGLRSSTRHCGPSISTRRSTLARSAPALRLARLSRRPRIHSRGEGERGPGMAGRPEPGPI